MRRARTAIDAAARLLLAAAIALWPAAAIAEGDGHGAKPPAAGAPAEAEHGGGAKHGGGEHHGYRHMDPKALVTQAAGFAILAYILWRYARPVIVRMLEERRQRIVATFEKLDRDEKEAADAKANAEYGLREVERGAAARLDEAAREAAELRDELFLEAEQYAARAQQRLALESRIQRETARLLVRNRLVDYSLRAAEETLRAGVDRATHDAIVDKFLDDLDAAAPKAS
jgi:ATP synthase F0 subunit b